MEPKILQNQNEYRTALEQVEALMDAAPGSPEEQALELWTLLIEDYESKHHPVPPPDPIEAIRFRMDQLGLKPGDLTAYIPSKSKVSEVLNRKRPLTLAMIRRLRARLGSPADVLIGRARMKLRRPRSVPEGRSSRERVALLTPLAGRRGAARACRGDRAASSRTRCRRSRPWPRVFGSLS